MPVSTANVLSRMVDPQLQEVDTTLACMLYGPVGGGKTTLAVGLAQQLWTSDDSRTAYVDSRQNWTSLKNIKAPDGSMPLLTNLTRLPYTGYGDIIALANGIKKNTKGFENIEVVILDEADAMSEQVLDTLVRERLSTPDDDIPDENPDWTDYRPMGALIEKAVLALLDAGVHVILVAHDQQKPDHRKVVMTVPSFSPKLNEKLQRIMHVTGHVTAEIKGSNNAPTYARQVQSMPTALVVAKTRAGGLNKAVKLSFKDFTEIVADWVFEGGVEEANIEADVESLTGVDELPTDGIPVSDDYDEDTPVFVGDSE